MAPNAIVLVTDRLGAGYLGPYGNTWIETPAWNRLAAEATLFETALVDTPSLARIYDSYWQGRHALSLPSQPSPPALAELLGEKPVQSWLITDERLVAEHPAAAAFDERVVLPPGEERMTGTLEGTQLARLFATIIDVVRQQATPPFLIWVHAQAMQGPWDAPYYLRSQFVEPGDPAPPDFTHPPEVHLKADCDPDFLLGIQHAYGGQVALFDSCLDILLDALGSSSLSDTTALLATAARGHPIGEHRYVGRGELPLYGELLQVPWILRWPQLAGATWRVHQMVQPPDLYTTLLKWFGMPSPAAAWGRALRPEDIKFSATPDQLIACARHDEQVAIRVPGWFMRRVGEQEVELFVKPDDRWECNEISDRCVQVVETITRTLNQFQAAVHANQRDQIPSLDHKLWQTFF
ncbi:MAG: sulfatase-like hydrolase/transferase [Planctomycetota bacterium]